jgi:putative hydrolase of the HAD superfamily
VNARAGKRLVAARPPPNVPVVTYRAVIFDLGGVVLPSPFEAFRAYERARGLPHRFISDVVVSGGDHGAWSRFERGELGPDEFATAFEAECVAAGGAVVVADLLTSFGGESAPRPEMVTALEAIRAHGLRTGALTNNWADVDGATHITGETELAVSLAALFDVIVESARVGLRKPDPRIYALVCELLGVEPHEAVFLDDLGANLKPARAMGMTTIKVDDAHEAIRTLSHELGIDLG